MACTGSSLTVENYEDSPASVSTSAIAGNESVKQRVPYSRRRHSSFHPRTDRRGSDGSSMEGEEGYLLRVSFDTFTLVHARVVLPIETRSDKLLSLFIGRYLPLRIRKTARFPGYIWEPQYRCRHLESLCDFTSRAGALLASVWGSDRRRKATGENHGRNSRVEISRCTRCKGDTRRESPHRDHSPRRHPVRL